MPMLWVIPILDNQYINVNQGKEEKAREYTEEEKRQILYEYHDALMGGHQEVARTLSRIWLNWRDTKDVEEYINKCEYCQKNKLIRTKMPLAINNIYHSKRL